MEIKPETDRSSERWELIFSSRYLYKAEILKGILEEDDIQAVIVNKQDSAYLFGEIEVYVNLDNILRAQKILQKFLEDE